MPKAANANVELLLEIAIIRFRIEKLIDQSKLAQIKLNLANRNNAVCTQRIEKAQQSITLLLTQKDNYSVAVYEQLLGDANRKLVCLSNEKSLRDRELDKAVDSVYNYRSQLSEQQQQLHQLDLALKLLTAKEPSEKAEETMSSVLQQVRSRGQKKLKL